MGKSKRILYFKQKSEKDAPVNGKTIFYKKGRQMIDIEEAYDNLAYHTKESATLPLTFS